MKIEKITTYTFPTKIVFGPGAVLSLPKNLLSAGSLRPLIVTDRQVANLSFMEKIKEQLWGAGLVPVIFSSIHANPIKSDVMASVAVYADSRCDSVVGIGGGAALDVARAVALAAYHPLDLFEYEDIEENWKRVTGRDSLFCDSANNRWNR